MGLECEHPLLTVRIVSYVVKSCRWEAKSAIAVYQQWKISRNGSIYSAHGYMDLYQWRVLEMRINEPWIESQDDTMGVILACDHLISSQ